MGFEGSTARKKNQHVSAHFFGCCKCPTMLIGSSDEPATPGWRRVETDKWICPRCDDLDRRFPAFSN